GRRHHVTVGELLVRLQLAGVVRRRREGAALRRVRLRGLLARGDVHQELVDVVLEQEGAVVIRTGRVQRDHVVGRADRDRLATTATAAVAVALLALAARAERDDEGRCYG